MANAEQVAKQNQRGEDSNATIQKSWLLPHNLLSGCGSPDHSIRCLSRFVAQSLKYDSCIIRSSRVLFSLRRWDLARAEEWDRRLSPEVWENDEFAKLLDALKTGAA